MRQALEQFAIRCLRGAIRRLGGRRVQAIRLPVAAYHSVDRVTRRG